MDESKTVEGTEDLRLDQLCVGDWASFVITHHVHLPVDAPEKWRNGESQDAVPSPIRGGSQRHSLCANFCREDLRGVCPRRWSPGGGKGGDEEIGTGNDGLGHSGVLLWHDPRDILVCLVWIRDSIGSLKGASGKKPDHHQEAADQERGTATELVKVEDGWQCHHDVDNVLDGRSEELVCDTSAAHDEDNVVHLPSC